MRQASAADAEELDALWSAAGLLENRVPVAAQLAEALAAAPDLVLVAETADRRLVGSLVGAFDGRRGWVNRLAVAPDHQGRGIGGALLAVFEQRVAARGCRKVNLLVTPDNVAVTDFYARHGYASAPLVFMEKWLD